MNNMSKIMNKIQFAYEHLENIGRYYKAKI